MSPPSHSTSTSSRRHNSQHHLGRVADYGAMDVFAFQREGICAAENYKESKNHNEQMSLTDDDVLPRWEVGHSTTPVQFDPKLFEIGSTKKKHRGSSERKPNEGKKHKSSPEKRRRHGPPESAEPSAEVMSNKSSAAVEQNSMKRSLYLSRASPKVTFHRDGDCTKLNRLPSKNRTPTPTELTPRGMTPFNSPRPMPFSSPQLTRIRSRRRSRLSSLLCSRAASFEEDFDPDLLETTDDEEHIYHAPFDECIILPEHLKRYKSVQDISTSDPELSARINRHRRPPLRQDSSRSQPERRSLLDWVTNKFCRCPIVKY